VLFLHPPTSSPVISPLLSPLLRGYVSVHRRIRASVLVAKPALPPLQIVTAADGMPSGRSGARWLVGVSDRYTRPTRSGKVKTGGQSQQAVEVRTVKSSFPLSFCIPSPTMLCVLCHQMALSLARAGDQLLLVHVRREAEGTGNQGAVAAQSYLEDYGLHVLVRIESLYIHMRWLLFFDSGWEYICKV